MADGLDLGQHGMAATGTATLITAAVTAGIARFFRGRDEKEHIETLAVMKEKLDQVLKEIAKLTTLAERVAVVEGWMKQQGDLRERLVILETKVSQQGDLRDRMVSVEGKAVAAHSRMDRFERNRDAHEG